MHASWRSKSLLGACGPCRWFECELEEHMVIRYELQVMSGNRLACFRSQHHGSKHCEVSSTGCWHFQLHLLLWQDGEKGSESGGSDLCNKQQTSHCIAVGLSLDVRVTWRNGLGQLCPPLVSEQRLTTQLVYKVCKCMSPTQITPFAMADGKVNVRLLELVPESVTACYCCKTCKAFLG